MKFKIAADSSSNVFSFSGVDYACAPLTVITAEKQYPDTPDLDVDAMIDDLKTVEGKTSTSCPNVQDWLDAFEGADGIFAVTITSNLSGSYASCVNARDVFLQDHPDVKISVLDTLSTGPEMVLIIEKLRELLHSGHDFETIDRLIREYMTQTHLSFVLASLTNFARNGRVSPLVAKMVGVLGIRLVGVASDVGTLEPLHKSRGEKKAMEALYNDMKERGFRGGKVRLAHCRNESYANNLKDLIHSEFPQCDVTIIPCGALCSYYAEEGGLLVGYEG